MKNIIPLIVVVLSFFYPWISLSLICIVVLYLSYLHYASTKKSSKIISTYKYEIINYFNEKIGNGEFHFNYVKKSSQYFLFPGSSREFSKILTTSYLSLIAIVIVQFFRFENSYLFIAFSVPIIIISALVSVSFEKPVLDYQNKERAHVKRTPLYKGVNEYPEFFYHGPWSEIQNSKNYV